MLHLESITLLRQEIGASREERIAQVEKCPRLFLHRRAKSTWNSLHLMMDTETGFPIDRWTTDRSEISYQTKPTNIGLGLLSYLAAEELQCIPPEEANHGIQKILDSLLKIQKNPYFFDWYDSRTGQPLEFWPESNQRLTPFISTVDNAWLILALLLIRQCKPQFRQIDELLQPLDMDTFFDEEHNEFVGGFAGEEPTSWRYSNLFLSESRIAHHVKAVMNKDRDLPANRMTKNTGNWPESSFGGSMFELLMPQLFIDEPYLQDAVIKHIQQQIEYGKTHAETFWGLSVCETPDGYTELGVGGHYQQFPIITPHAIFLTLQASPEEALQLLRLLEATFPVYSTDMGYQDSVDVQSSKVAKSQLFLDNAMILLAITNNLSKGFFQQRFNEMYT